MSLLYPYFSMLTEWHPQWVAEGERIGLGIAMLCPYCGTETLRLMFENPLDGGPRGSDLVLCWTRKGDTFNTLTLEGDINLLVRPVHGCFRIAGGSIIPCVIVH